LICYTASTIAVRRQQAPQGVCKYIQGCTKIHVIGSNLALVVPLSTKIKEMAGYMPFEFQGKVGSLCIHQCRTISQKRILSRKGRISDKKLAEIKASVKSFFAL